LGAAVGAGAGAISGALSDIGINDDFMKKLAAGMTSNTSVLFVLVRKATPDKVVEEIQKYGGTVLRSSLSHEDEAKLQAALSQGRRLSRSTKRGLEYCVFRLKANGSIIGRALLPVAGLTGKSARPTIVKNQTDHK
jgi:hypothetical protein